MSYEQQQQQHMHTMTYGYPQHYDQLGMEIPSYEHHPNVVASTSSSSSMNGGMHMHHHQQMQPQHNSYGYQGPPMSLKRKSPMYQDQQPASNPQFSFAHAAASMVEQQNPPPQQQPLLLESVSSPRQPNCDLCKYPDPILYVPTCGHTFHSRCVGEWPMTRCPYCHGEVAKVAVVHIDMTSKTTQRSGKWTKQEEKFVNLIVDEFDHGTFPLANGTPVRLVLAKLLNCSPMRLSKKFQKNALGKRTYRVPKNSASGARISFDAASHQARQIEFSAVESAFRQEVVLLQRKDNKQDGYIELRDLRLAVIQFWVSNFLKFALSVGQQVEGLDTTEPKKKKQAMQKLRDGMFDQVLSWGEKRPPSPPQPPPTLQSWEVPYFKSEPFKPYEDENSDDRDLNAGEIPFQPTIEYNKMPPQQPQQQHQQQPQLHRHQGAYRDPSPSSPSYAINAYSNQYKRPQTREPTGRMALTPLSMRAGAMRTLPETGVYDDQTSSPELDGLLMGNTPSNAPFRITQSHPPASTAPTPSTNPAHYDTMDSMPPANASWDQMLDDFAGINSTLSDPALNSYLQLS